MKLENFYLKIKSIELKNHFSNLEIYFRIKQKLIYFFDLKLLKNNFLIFLLNL